MTCSLDLDAVVQSDRLPSLPQVALRVIELARQTEPDFTEVASVIRSDPALCAKILKTANSALLGLRRTVVSIDDALPQLGVNLVRTLVLSFTLARHQSRQGELDATLRQFWRSCLTQAVFAEQLAGMTPGADPSTYFLAGLLQDIGVLALLQEAPDAYLADVMDASAFPDVVAAEHRCFGFTHVDVTQRICARWGLDEEFTYAVARHHDRVAPTGEQSSPRRGAAMLSVALQAANLAATWVESRTGRGYRVAGRLAQLLNDQYSADAETVEELLSETCSRVGETAALFRFDIGHNQPMDRILDSAKNVLEELALVAQLESRAHQRRLRDEARRDPMTGVYNRRFMEELVHERLAFEIRRGKPIGLLFLDIDRFKSINDDCGHQAGDEAICLVADVLQRAVRRNDCVVRYGGDEFLVLLYRVNLAQLEKIAERVRSGIQSVRLSSNSEVHVTTSVGAVHYVAGKDDTQDANWLVQQADQAMYEAKREGGNQIEFYSLTSLDAPQPAMV